MNKLSSNSTGSKVDRVQASADLAHFIAQGLVDFSKRPQYGFGPPRITAQDAKEAINAVNNLAKLSLRNDNEIEFCNKVSEFAKWFVDYVENRERW